jgi:hypothetical protein
MKVLTTGSRTWRGVYGEWIIQLTLNRLEALAIALHSPLRLMNGACPEGADAIVQRWCDRRGVPLDAFPADWANYGKAAGPMRNMYMVHLGADMCVAFLRDNSKGTEGTINLARAAKIPTFVVPWDDTTPPSMNELLSHEQGGIPPV